MKWKTWKNLIILKHKLRTESAATKFMQGSTSNPQLAVKSLAKNRKAWLHEKYSKQIMFKQRWISTKQTTTPMSSKFLRTCFICLWMFHKFLRIYLDINWSNNFDKIKPHIIKLISTGSSIVFLDPKFFRHEYTTKVELQ